MTCRPRDRPANSAITAPYYAGRILNMGYSNNLATSLISSSPDSFPFHPVRFSQRDGVNDQLSRMFGYPREIPSPITVVVSVVKRKNHQAQAARREISSRTPVRTLDSSEKRGNASVTGYDLLLRHCSNFNSAAYEVSFNCDIDRARAPIKSHSPQLPRCYQRPVDRFANGEYLCTNGERANREVGCEVEDEETRKIVDSGQHGGLRCHTSLPASSGGAGSKSSPSGNVKLPRGNPRFYMHSLISLSEIYGEREHAPCSYARHFSYRADRRDALSQPLIAFPCSSRNCL